MKYAKKINLVKLFMITGQSQFKLKTDYNLFLVELTWRGFDFRCDKKNGSTGNNKDITQI